MFVHSRRRGWRGLLLGAITLPLPWITGCAGTFDDVTSQRFLDQPFHTLFHRDDPIYVLRNVQEADDRAKAMLVVKEPKTSGGNDALQDEVLKYLTDAATSDPHTICRLNAIETLGRFEDPRTANVLLTAYHRAGVDATPEPPSAKNNNGVMQAAFWNKKRSTAFNVPSFSPDQVLTMQCRALEALGRKHTPEAVELLIQVAMTPVKLENKASETDVLLQTASNSAGQDQFDLRLAAIRGLGYCTGDPRVGQVLYKIMIGEKKDVATKSRAHISLVKVMDKDYPPESPEWVNLLKIDPATLPVAAKVPAPKQAGPKEPGRLPISDVPTGQQPAPGPANLTRSPPSGAGIVGPPPFQPQPGPPSVTPTLPQTLAPAVTLPPQQPSSTAPTMAPVTTIQPPVPPNPPQTPAKSLPMFPQGPPPIVPNQQSQAPTPSAPARTGVAPPPMGQAAIQPPMAAPATQFSAGAPAEGIVAPPDNPSQKP